MPTAELAAELRAVRSWLVDEALPLWADRGFDPSAQLFEERLDVSGASIVTAPRRLLTQCRQLYVYSHATLLGWFDGRALVESAFASMRSAYADRVAGTPYVFSITRSGEIADPRQDTYGYAFVLFALAWVRKLLGEQVEARLPQGLISHLTAELAHPSGLGFVCGAPRPDRFLRQNPHMHLLEAFLELDAAFGDVGARAQAERMFRLFRERLFLARAHSLPELHDDEFTAVTTPEAVFEPGHHFEWIWLLDRYAALTGEPVEDLVAALAKRAFSEGIDRDGAAIETVRIDGQGGMTSRRCWGSCEGLKAAASNFEHKRGSQEAVLRQAAHFLGAMRKLFLSGPFPGGWVDRVDEEGKPLVDYVPATTLYHIMLAVAEAERVFGPTIGH